MVNVRHVRLFLLDSNHVFQFNVWQASPWNFDGANNNVRRLCTYIERFENVERELAALFSSLLGNFPSWSRVRFPGQKFTNPMKGSVHSIFTNPFLDSACLTIEDFLPSFSLSLSLSLSLSRSESLHNATTMIKYSLACKSKSHRSRCVCVCVCKCITRMCTQRSSLRVWTAGRGWVNERAAWGGGECAAECL